MGQPEGFRPAASTGPSGFYFQGPVTETRFPPIQDITSLLHTIYEVVDSSVNHSPTSSKMLRVKLTVAPEGSQSKRSILVNQAGEGCRAKPG